jgi:hypothetical protein
MEILIETKEYDKILGVVDSRTGPREARPLQCLVQLDDGRVDRIKREAAEEAQRHGQVRKSEDEGEPIVGEPTRVCCAACCAPCAVC